MKQYEDPKWVTSQAISLDYNYAMADFAGGRGLKSEELEAFTPRLTQVDASRAGQRVEGGKLTANGLLGRPGYEVRKQEFEGAAPKSAKYMIK